MIYFTAHTFKCVCHCRRAMFRVLGMYNFALRVEILFTLLIKTVCKKSIWAALFRTSVGTPRRSSQVLLGYTYKRHLIIFVFTVLFDLYIFFQPNICRIKKRLELFLLQTLLTLTINYSVNIYFQSVIISTLFQPGGDRLCTP